MHLKLAAVSVVLRGWTICRSLLAINIRSCLSWMLLS